MTGLLIAVAALWGAAVGVLVPRAAYRFSVPPDEAWRDRCPGGHPMRGPIRGWIGWARCGECAGGAVVTSAAETAVLTRMYGPSTPLVALTTALLCAALAAATDTRPEVAVWLLLAPVGVLLAVVDFRVQRLPDVLTLPLAAAALVLLGLVTLVPEHTGHWPSAALGALALGGGYLVLFLINPGGMGFGDVKLALGMGAVLGWYGWATVMVGTLAGFLLGALYGGALVVARRAGRKTGIPFGPFLIAGAFLGVLIGAYAA
ncbi:prepilin peptidase [Streptomyces sp. NL15-2K]|uniref:prepilin peptidase n=1 Tax=Streptomyces sp. NL15-2K TaxID=376149 RepID=UPI000F580E41|nr:MULTISPECIES: prepilin peptidase [Actinomycetes]WKX11621.1 prepilin peptidase [Kutzneria buriramensis]GCB46967.1 type IV peptidase [Streptomyces sp. NL15-2K]